MKTSICLLLLILLFSPALLIGQTKESHKQLIEKSKKLVNTNRAESLHLLQEAVKTQNLSDSAYMDIYNATALFYKEGGAHYMALNYYYKELEIQKKIDPKKTFFIENNIGACYFFLEDYKKARLFWEKSLSAYELFFKNNPKNDQNLEGTLIYNNLGVLEKTEGNYQKALEILNKFKTKNELLKDTLNIIMAEENISDVYSEMGNHSKALKNIHRGLMLAKKLDSDFDIASLSLKSGLLYLKHHPVSTDSSLHYLVKAFQLSKEKGFIKMSLESSEGIALLYEKNKEYQKAYEYLRIAKGLSEEITLNENKKKVNMLELEQQEKIHQYELTTQQQKREMYLTAGILLLLLLSSIVFLMFKLQKSKAQKRKIEKELLAREIEKKNKEIRSNTLQIIQNTEIIKSAQKKLEVLRDNPGKTSDTDFSKILNDLKNGTQAFNKQEFEKLFLEIDNEFYKNLLNKHPDLTKNELRLSAFLKLNLTSKEISAITQQTPHSITVARSRLRKKLGINNDENIIHYLIRLGK